LVVVNKMGFQLASLVLIVPVGGAFLAGVFCICKHKWSMFTLSRTKVESAADSSGEKDIEAQSASKHARGDPVRDHDFMNVDSRFGIDGLRH
jgi:hypothetical protein